MKKKMSKRGALAVAVIWTAVTVMWLINLAVRLGRSYEDEGVLILTVITLLASIAAAVANWYRYINYEE